VMYGGSAANKRSYIREAGVQHGACVIFGRE